MYKLGVRSRQRLKGVHEDLVKVVERAIEITTIDFTVLEGLRTLISCCYFRVDKVNKFFRWNSYFSNFSNWKRNIHKNRYSRI